jgi:hypothetical protein
MLATGSDLEIAETLPAVNEQRAAGSVDALAELESELSSARGLVHGMLLGLISLAVVGGAVWLAF